MEYIFIKIKKYIFYFLLKKEHVFLRICPTKKRKCPTKTSHEKKQGLYEIYSLFYNKAGTKRERKKKYIYMRYIYFFSILSHEN